MMDFQTWLGPLKMVEIMVFKFGVAMVTAHLQQLLYIRSSWTTPELVEVPLLEEIAPNKVSLSILTVMAVSIMFSLKMIVFLFGQVLGMGSLTGPLQQLLLA